MEEARYWLDALGNCEVGLQVAFVLMLPPEFFVRNGKMTSQLCALRFVCCECVCLNDVCARVIWMQWEMCDHVGNYLDVL